MKKKKISSKLGYILKSLRISLFKTQTNAIVVTVDATRHQQYDRHCSGINVIWQIIEINERLEGTSTTKICAKNRIKTKINIGKLRLTLNDLILFRFEYLCNVHVWNHFVCISVNVCVCVHFATLFCFLISIFSLSLLFQFFFFKSVNNYIL